MIHVTLAPGRWASSQGPPHAAALKGAEIGWPFLRVTNTVRLGIDVDRSDLAKVDAPRSAELERTRTKVGDVLVSITANLGAVAVVPPDLAGANVSQHVALLRADSNVCDSRWLAWTIQTPMFRSALTTSGYGADSPLAGAEAGADHGCGDGRVRRDDSFREGSRMTMPAPWNLMVSGLLGPHPTRRRLPAPPPVIRGAPEPAPRRG